MCDGPGQNEIVSVCKNSGPVLSRLWTKFVKFWDNVGGPLCFPVPLPDSLSSAGVRQIGEKRTNVKVFWPPVFWEVRPQLFYGRMLVRFTAHRCQGFVEFCLLISVCEACQWKWNAEFTEGTGKNYGQI